MRIFFFTKYDTKGASSRYRTYQFLPFYRENNIDCTVTAFFSNKYISALYAGNPKKYFYIIFSYLKRFFTFFKSLGYDLIFIEYELFPYFPSFFERLLRLLGKKYVIDYDDAIFHNYDLHKIPVIRLLLKNKIKNVIRKASVVTVGSEYLYQYAIKSNKNVYKVPTVVNLRLYKTINVVKKDDKFVIGWIGSPSTSHYLVPLVEVFRRLTLPNIQFKFIGTDSKIHDKFEGIPVEWVEWDAKNEIEELKSFSVGIMPLTDNHWSKGKCGFKLIQYLACSIPVVASPVGENKIIVEHQKNGYLADNNDEWFYYLLKMYKEQKWLPVMGKFGFKLIENKYSLGVASKKLIEIFKSNQ